MIYPAEPVRPTSTFGGTFHGSGNYVVDLSHAEMVAQKRGRPPGPTIVTSNPKYDEWLEGAALVLCIEAEECGVIPTPCSAHLAEARRIANHLLQQITNTVGRVSHESD